jgi:DNA-directed RNA polymerase specialized sigma24 family protein
MESEATLKKDWTITAEAFDKLLVWLDDDRDVAGEKYEKIRLKLMKLFKWRNCTPEEDYTDVTIDRVARRVFEGAEMRVADPYLYFHGIALNVIREFWRKQQKRATEDIDETSDLELSTVQSHAQKMEQELERDVAEKRYDCMRKCLLQLPEDTREFIIEYHQGERKKDARKEMSERLKIHINALRIRAFRVREGLEKCVERCVKITV